MLALDKHAIEIISEDGSAKASFVVNKAVASVINGNSANGANATTTGSTTSATTGTLVQTAATGSKASVGTALAPATAVIASTAKLPQTGKASGPAGMPSAFGGSVLVGFGMLLRRKKH